MIKLKSQVCSCLKHCYNLKLIPFYLTNASYIPSTWLLSIWVMSMTLFSMICTIKHVLLWCNYIQPFITVGWYRAVTLLQAEQWAVSLEQGYKNIYYITFNVSTIDLWTVIVKQLIYLRLGTFVCKPKQILTYITSYKSFDFIIIATVCKQMCQYPWKIYF